MKDLTIELRGQRVTIKDIFIAGSDMSVGIMVDYLDEFTIWDDNGIELVDWYDTLTDEENELIENKVMDEYRRELEQYYRECEPNFEQFDND